PPSPVTWLLVPDRALPEVAATVPPGGVLLHASGAADVDVLRPHRPAGSLHPLMTFPGPELARPPLEGLPAAIAGDREAADVATTLARFLGMHPFEVPGDRRLYHAAAVVAGNFSTVLLAAGALLLERAGVSPDEAPGLLLPLVRASLDNAASLGPARALTGPVARGDRAVMDGHRAAMTDEIPGLLPVYDALADAAAALAGHHPPFASPDPNHDASREDTAGTGDLPRQG
ncbi:MAG: DUF2520 domain-containing protein, partial [Deltaproteobacteria bacterium]